MRRILGLLRKEWWEHGLLVLVLLVLLVAVLVLLLVGATSAARTITMLEAHATFVRFFVPLTGFALGNRLVVREYQGRTQRFVEALPIRRWEVVTVKLAVGFTILSIACLGSLALSALAASIREPITLRWLLLIALRSELFVFVLWCALFPMGLLGRVRFAIYIGLLVFLLFLDATTDIEIARFGPIALVGETFVLEREALHLGDVLTSLAVALGALGVGFLLALIREGSVAESLSRRMSQREKAALGIAAIGGMIVIGTAGESRKKEPFAFRGETVVHARGAPIDVIYMEARHRRAAEEIAALLASDVQRVRRIAGISSLPRAHVALRVTLDARTVEPVELEQQSGILLHANFVAPGFDRAALRAAVLQRVLEEATDGRAAFEPYAWVRTALAATLAYEGSPARVPAMRALWLARQRAPSWTLLERWQRTDERFGPAAAAGMAYAAAKAIEARRGRAAWLAFARSVAGREPPWGMRAVWDAWRDPPRERLARHAGLNERELIDAWRAQNVRWRSERSLSLRTVPRTRATIAIERDVGDVRTIRWSIRFLDPPERGSQCALVHAALGPFDAPIEESDLQREERPCTELAGPQRLVGRYGPGDRVLLAIEVDSPTLGAPVRIHSERREIR